MMKTATAIFTFLIVVGAAVFFFWSRSKRQRINSFWDVVRNPDAMPDLDDFHKYVDEAATSLTGSSTKIAQLVDYFVFEAKSSRDAWTELRILAKLGNEAYPRALEILRDPSLKERLTLLTKHENSTIPDVPISRLCEIFGQDAAPPKEAAALLAPYLHSESDVIRQSTALVIGSIAAADSLPDLRRALTDKEEYVRSYALMGIQRAIAGDRIVESYQDEFFVLVAHM
ncbi:MAG: HEAT repeat domain-containing protein [Planctomycetota bacterium]|nr:HEAT repeat domain-containing protein [Planctomycetota bacterium]MDA1177661.1 HEAT repeat domain-containing protein [Planctomycetota bacterium]